MPKTIIASNPNFRREVDKTKPFLNVAEFFSRTIQGEGASTGVPSTFLRLQHCTLDCSWCDSASVWKFGNPYSVEEILNLMYDEGVVDDLRKGHHLILTGGSPMLQQNNLIHLIESFIDRFEFKPYIEIENEATIMPLESFAFYIDQWNNSPKLVNSGMRAQVRYKPEILKYLSDQGNSWFKFVVSHEQDWDEIFYDFVDTYLVGRDQVILMPEGQNQEELKKSRLLTVEIAVREGLRFSDREHINIWDRMTGV